FMNMLFKRRGGCGRPVTVQGITQPSAVPPERSWPRAHTPISMGSVCPPAEAVAPVRGRPSPRIGARKAHVQLSAHILTDDAPQAGVQAYRGHFLPHYLLQVKCT